MHDATATSVVDTIFVVVSAGGACTNRIRRTDRKLVFVLILSPQAERFDLIGQAFLPITQIGVEISANGPTSALRSVHTRRRFF